MAPGPRPPLMRAARLFRALGVVAMLVIFAYVGLAVYSASKLAGGGNSFGGNSNGNNSGNSGNNSGNGGQGTTTVGPNDAVTFSTSINLTNPGFLPINSIQVTAIVSMPGGPTLVHGGSPPVAIPPGQTATVPVSFTLPPLSASGPTALLVTHDATLPVALWVNVSFASIFGVTVNTSTNYSWGAPFSALNGSVGAPTTLGNGTVEVPVMISFQDHAKFSDVGNITASIRAPGGTVCAVPTYLIDVAPGSMYSQSDNVYLNGGCNPSGGTLVITFTGPEFQVTLPPEAIP